MRRLQVKNLLYLSGLIIGAFIFLLQVYSGIKSFNSTDATGKFWQMACMGLVGMSLVVGLQIINWGNLLKCAGVRLPLIDLGKGYVLSNLPKYIPGSIWGYLSRGQWLNKEHGIPFGLTNLANLFEIEVTLVSAASAILTALTIIRESLVFLAGAIILPIAVLFLTQALVRFLIKKGWFGLSTLPGAYNIKLRFLSVATLVSFLEWIVLGGVVLFLLTASHIDFWQINLRNLLLATESFTLAWLGGFFVIFVPGGLGVREAALTGLLLMNFSASYETASLVSITSRLLYSGGELIWLMIGFMLRGSSFGTKTIKK